MEKRFLLFVGMLLIFGAIMAESTNYVMITKTTSGGNQSGNVTDITFLVDRVTSNNDTLTNRINADNATQATAINTVGNNLGNEIALQAANNNTQSALINTKMSTNDNTTLTALIAANNNTIFNLQGSDNTTIKNVLATKVNTSTNGFYLFGDVNFNESQLNTTISNSLSATLYTPISIQTIYGTPSGALSDVTVLQDGKEYNITEASSANAMEVYLNFTGVKKFQSIIMRERYIGGTNHNIEVELLALDNVTWEAGYFTISLQSNFVTTVIPVFDNHVRTADGNVSIRFRHVQNGNTNHHFDIDYVALQNGLSNAITASTDHDALQNRNNESNHPFITTRISSNNNTLFDLINTKFNLSQWTSENTTIAATYSLITTVTSNNNTIFNRHGSDNTTVTNNISSLTNRLSIYFPNTNWSSENTTIQNLYFLKTTWTSENTTWQNNITSLTNRLSSYFPNTNWSSENTTIQNTYAKANDNTTQKDAINTKVNITDYVNNNNTLTTLIGTKMPSNDNTTLTNLITSNNNTLVSLIGTKSNLSTNTAVCAGITLPQNVTITNGVISSACATVSASGDNAGADNKTLTDTITSNNNTLNNLKMNINDNTTILNSLNTKVNITDFINNNNTLTTLIGTKMPSNDNTTLTALITSNNNTIFNRHGSDNTTLRDAINIKANQSDLANNATIFNRQGSDNTTNAAAIGNKVNLSSYFVKTFDFFFPQSLGGNVTINATQIFLLSRAGTLKNLYCRANSTAIRAWNCTVVYNGIEQTLRGTTSTQGEASVKDTVNTVTTTAFGNLTLNLRLGNGTATGLLTPRAIVEFYATSG